MIRFFHMLILKSISLVVISRQWCVSTVGAESQGLRRISPSMRKSAFTVRALAILVTLSSIEMPWKTINARISHRKRETQRNT